MATYIRKKGTPISEKGSVAGQTYLGLDGLIHDPTEDNMDPVIDETGLASPEETKDLLRNFTIENFHDRFLNHTEEVLGYLLSVQSNDSPLKKGGADVSFRADALITQQRNSLSASASTILDICLGCISSEPENQHYVISAARINSILGYQNERNGYRVTKSIIEDLKNFFCFEVNASNGKAQIQVPWFEMISYVSGDRTTGNESRIIFTPHKLLKMLAISAGFSRGGYYNIEVAAKIRKNHIKNLFYLLESRKRYQDATSTRMGEFTIDVDSLKTILFLPDSYKANDIKRHVLDPAEAGEINALPDIDINFHYEPVRKGRTIIGFRFSITEIYERKTIAQKENAPMPSPEDELISSILVGQDFSAADVASIAKALKKNNRDVAFLTNALVKLATSSNIRNRTAFLISIINGDVDPSASQNQNTASGNSGNAFHNFKERDNDYDQIQAELIRRSMEQ